MRNSLVSITETPKPPATLIVLDRPRKIKYQGKEMKMNNFFCSECKKDYCFEHRVHKFCIFCGIEYKKQYGFSAR
jgi:hypothetical protein